LEPGTVNRTSSTNASSSDSSEARVDGNGEFPSQQDGSQTVGSVNDGIGFYTEKEELANTITHAFGAILAVAGLYLLLVESRWTDIWKLLTCLIFGSSLIVAYSASALYHGVRGPEWKRFWRSVDHVTIYFLIAGTYTPFVLIILPVAWGWTLFTIVWLLALLGMMIRVFNWQLPDHVSTAPYLAMGWVALAAIKPMIDYSLIHGWGMLSLLVLGGLCYSGGTIFYNKMEMPYNHAYWHLAVLAGSLCHYFAVLFYVIPF
jgi:hemolysin III